MRKLKRKPTRIQEEKNEPTSKKKVFFFKRKQCEFINENGERCSKRSAGKGNFCNTHSTVTFYDNSNDLSSSTKLLTKYDPINHPTMFIELSGQGLSPTEIASVFRVSMETINTWREQHILFNQAFEIGKSAHEAWYLRTGKENLDNRFFQTPLFKFLTMNNGLNWSDKAETKSQVQGQFGVLLVPGQMSVDEWEQNNISREQELQKRLEAELIEIDNDTCE